MAALNLGNDPNAYKTGLQNSFQTGGGTVNPAQPFGNPTFTGPNVGNLGDDQDVSQAKQIANEEAQARAGMNSGVSYNADDAVLSQLKARINAKNHLGSQIAGAQGLLDQELGNTKQSWNSALGEGLRNTRGNYADRGLGYSTARVGAEQDVRNQAGLGYASDVASEQSAAQNAVSKAMGQYAGVDQQTEAQNTALATQAFDISAQNQVARAQAQQQLGAGIGMAAGTAVGGYLSSQDSSYTNPTAGWSPQTSFDGQAPQLGSQFAPPAQGLLDTPGGQSQWYMSPTNAGAQTYGSPP